MAWTELSDVRCYYELLGDGEPLLLIPGLATTCRLWDPATPLLSEHFCCIGFDNRGIGRSVGRRHPHTLRDYSTDIVELLDALQLDRAHVLGVSLGGIIAQRFAMDFPERVDNLILISCSHFFTPYLRQMSLLLAHGLRHFNTETFSRMMELLATSPEFHDAHPELFERRIADKCARKIDRRAIGAQLRCLARSEFVPEEYRITAPTLVLAGEYDPIIPGCYARKMADMIAGSTFRLIEGAGHNPLVDEPERIVPIIERFVHRNGLSRNGKVKENSKELAPGVEASAWGGVLS